jgi:hypothetical protein
MKYNATFLTRLTNDVDTENAVRLLLAKELHEALSIEVGLGTRVCSEREFANIVFHTSGFELLLGLADP